MDLEGRALRVISVMQEIPELADLPIDELKKIPLGWLRESSVRRHGLCIWNCPYPLRLQDTNPSDVELIKIHPYAITEEWSRYADHILYHEYLHALGFHDHNSVFREMEALWPDAGAKGMGSDFTEFLLEKNHKWVMMCTRCGKKWRSVRPFRDAEWRICPKCDLALEHFARET